MRGHGNFALDGYDESATRATLVERIDPLTIDDNDAAPDRHQRQTMRRFITWGSVGDSKSTPIGRPNYDSHTLFDDRRAALEANRARIGRQRLAIDSALLVDGLSAEHDQGSTMDVAYRFFAIAKRKVIVADTSGDAQYTCSIVTGASAANLVVILSKNLGFTETDRIENIRRVGEAATLMADSELIVERVLQ